MSPYSSYLKKIHLPFFILLLIGCFYLSSLLTHNPPAQQATSEWGARDFPVFWAAWQVYQSGEHLYTRENFHRYRSDSDEIPDIMHNPPWVLWIVAPVAWLPYPFALAAWLVWNFILMLINIYLVLRLWNRPLPSPLMLFALCFFAPAVSCWHFGQLAITLTTICLLLLHCLQRKWFWAAGSCLALMTVKPQIYFLLAFAIGLQALYTRRWQLFAGFGIMQGILMAPFIVENSSFTDWLAYLPEGRAPLLMTATLTTWIRILTASIGTIPADWPLVATPVVGLLGVGIWMMIHRQVIDVDWRERAIPLIALSLLFAPYAWPYDYSLLILWHAFMIYSKDSTFLMRTVGVLASVLFLVQVGWISGELHHLVWYPAIAAISYFHILWLRKSSNTCQLSI